MVDPPQGPGRSDARSLAEELLLAIRDGDYDGFVAKCSAFFRAAATTERFAHAGQKIGGRLSHDYQIATLGTLRHPHAILWLFKIEFTDGGDDAVATLAMNGWQVAGFYVEDPIPLPAETSP